MMHLDSCPRINFLQGNLDGQMDRWRLWLAILALTSTGAAKSGKSKTSRASINAGLQEGGGFNY